jgi:hypothetical protein
MQYKPLSQPYANGIRAWGALLQVCASVNQSYEEFLAHSTGHDAETWLGSAHSCGCGLLSRTVILPCCLLKGLGRIETELSEGTIWMREGMHIIRSNASLQASGAKRRLVWPGLAENG